MPKRKVLSSKFAGELSTPIELTPRHKLSPPSALFDPEGFDGVEKWWRELAAKEAGHVVMQRSTKTLMLFKHYNLNPIDSGAWQKLAVCLANDCVPGFQLVRSQKQGRKNVWDYSKLLTLWWAVKSQKKKAARFVCFNLAKKEPWKNLLRNKTEDARQKRLYAVYEEALKHPFVKFASNVLNDWRLEENEREKWVQEFVDVLENHAAQPLRPLLFDEKLVK
ncbi:MAG: hypothetical protein WCD70_01940 [Alphaproteobacteria bacterium]